MLNPARSRSIRLSSLCVVLSIVALSLVGTAEMASDVKPNAFEHARVAEVTGLPLSRAHSRLFQTASQGEKTVEQVQKNIQVLQGMPQAQLIPVMNFISSSLGVRCTFCHINKEGKWDFASDEKPEKGTAREMIRMVQNINKTTFRGALEVSCYTCHRGRTRPISVPVLPLAEIARPAAVPAGAAAPSPTPAPPTAEQVLAKYQEALGAPAAIEKLKTRTIKGTTVTGAGQSAGFDVIQAAPDKILITLNTAQQGVFERGYNGTIGWEQSARGLRDLTGDELAFVRRYWSLFGDMRLKDQIPTVAFSGKDKINDREVYVLRGTNAANKRERLFFDAQTGLLVRRIVYTPTPVGIIPEQVDFEDYRDVDGIKMPFTIRVSSVDPNWTATRQFTEIKLNAPVDETKFNKPAPKPSPNASPSP
jgi:hypothetical protein